MKQTIYLLILLTLLVSCKDNVVKPTEEAPHNCRLLASISDNFPDNIITSQLINDSSSLERLGASNRDGWGIASYLDYDTDANINRGKLAAPDDANYDTVVVNLENTKPKIILSHVRICVTGCCAHDGTVPNPHPFIRYNKNGKMWTFAHNGVVSKTTMATLVKPEYLINNPYNGGFIAECNVSNPNLIVDSEMYMAYVMQQIEYNNWDVRKGIVNATKTMINTGLGSMNFVFSDGEKVWGFKYGNSLSYLYNGSYSTVASQPTSNNNVWVSMSDYQLVELSKDKAPVIIDIRTWSEPTPTCTVNWQCSEYSACTGYLQTRDCTDTNKCDDTSAKPKEAKICDLPCIPNWQCAEWNTCTSEGLQTRVCTDLNNCKPIESQTCTPTCVITWQCGSWSACNNNEQERTCTNNCNSELKTEKQNCAIIKPELLSNPSFDSNTIGWSFYVDTTATATGARTIVSSEYDTIPAGYKITLTKKGTKSSSTQLFTKGIPITTGKQYKLSMRVKSSVVVSGLIGINLINAASPYNSYAVESTRYYSATPDWTTLDIPFTASTTSSNARITIYNGMMQTGSVLYLDTISFKEI